MNNYLDLTKEQKKGVEQNDEDDTNCCCCTWDGSKEDLRN